VDESKNSVSHNRFGFAPINRVARWMFGGDSLESLTALGSLFYAGFIFVPAVFPIPSHIWLPQTLLSFALFLPVYLWTWRSRGRQRMVGGLILAALGFALQLSNPFANTYIIFAASVFATLPSWRFGFSLILGMLLSYSVWVLFLAQYLNYIGLLTAWIISLGVGILNALAAANQRKENSLRLSQEEVRQLARMAERERIGRDLHDLLGHTLSVIVLKAELASRLYERKPELAINEIRDVERIARESLGQVRRAVVGIRVAGLRAECAQARVALETANVRLHYPDAWPNMAVGLETVFALAVREATTNILRHAQASAAWIDLEQHGDWLELKVRDNGRCGPAKPGFGLNGMRERAEALGGRLSLDADASGWRLRMLLPYTPEASEREATARNIEPRLACRPAS